MRKILCLFMAAFLVACSSSTGGKSVEVREADVVVYGGTSAGVAAAVQAAREGKSVLIVCPDEQLGAMTSSGLGYTDAGKTDVIGGVAKEFYHRVWLEYQKPGAWKWQKKEDFLKHRGQGNKGMDDENRLSWIFEPSKAEAAYENWLAECGVKVYRNEWLNREDGVKKQGSKITQIEMLSGAVYKGKVFIDATFEGDLMAAAGCDYAVGRESASQYGEAHAGVRTQMLHHDHYFRKPISPYVKEGDPSSGLLKYVVPYSEVGKEGEGDTKVQAYCFRMCLTRVPENSIPFEKPANYNPADYELFLRYMLSEGRSKEFMIISPMPNGKSDCNNRGAFSTDFIGMNYSYPEASYEERAKIIQAHKDYQQGLYYFINTDPRVPQAFKDTMKGLGFAKDEFQKTGGWPFNLYIREARRLVGEYVMTENDCLSKRKVPNPIAMGSYTIDSHNIQRYETKDGFVQNEGDIGVYVKYPYGIAYGSIVPKKGQADNLLVAAACSASHLAYGSIRMEPVFMALGHAAATAAAIAVDLDVPVQNVPYAKLREKLLKDGQVLELSDELKASIDAKSRSRAKWLKNRADQVAKTKAAFKAAAEAKKNLNK